MFQTAQNYILKLNRIVFICFLVLVSFIVYPLVKAADTTPPVTTLTADPTVPNGENNWYVNYPDINISAIDDDTGVSAINWKVNDEPWQKNTFNQGLNVIQNPSFEQGYIQYWDFTGPFLSIGLKSSLFKHTGNYGASIISLGFYSDAYWQNTGSVTLIPLKTYTYSFYIASVTSFLDNAFYEVILDDNGTQTVIASQYNIDEKLNFKQFGGTFVAPSSPNTKFYIRIGIEGIGHLAIDDVYVSTASDAPEVNFTLDQEGENTISYYSEDATGNIEATKNTIVKVDTVSPLFSGFTTFNEESKQKFASKIDVFDTTSGLLDVPALFNYAVDGFTNGYFEEYNTCSGQFILDDYILLDTSYGYGDTEGVVSTPQIDYCDTNWVNCKRLNFYVKDLAGNVGSNSICVNGPYIVGKNGNAFARNSFYQMGLGDEDNVYGVVVSSGSIVDISSQIGAYVPNYPDPPYLNNLYSFYSNQLDSVLNTVTDIPSSSGVYSIDGDYVSDSNPTYLDANQVVFINGDLELNSDISATNSTVFYFVNGDITVNTTVTALAVHLISTGQIFTSSSDELTEKITIDGSLVSQDLVFSRNTDRTLGASEIIKFPIKDFFSGSYLDVNNLYWKEVVN